MLQSHTESTALCDFASPKRPISAFRPVWVPERDAEMLVLFTIPRAENQSREAAISAQFKAHVRRWWACFYRCRTYDWLCLENAPVECSLRRADGHRSCRSSSACLLQALGKLSRVQAAYATLEERLKIQEEAGARGLFCQSLELGFLPPSASGPGNGTSLEARGRSSDARLQCFFCKSG